MEPHGLTYTPGQSCGVDPRLAPADLHALVAQAPQHSLQQAGVGRADRLKAHGMQHAADEARLQLQQPRRADARGQHPERGILALPVAACAGGIARHCQKPCTSQQSLLRAATAMPLPCDISLLRKVHFYMRKPQLSAHTGKSVFAEPSAAQVAFSKQQSCGSSLTPNSISSALILLMIQSMASPKAHASKLCAMLAMLLTLLHVLP